MFSGKIIAGLPFVSTANENVDLWPLINETSWSRGCEIGRDRADQLLEFMRRHDDPNILLRVSEVIIAKGDFGALNVGFGTRLAERLLVRK
jgi:hypothetical protein